MVHSVMSRSTSEMRICTLNARGLGDRMKRKSMFQFLRKSADVIFLQELHIESVEKLHLWHTEWGGQLYTSLRESNKHGIAILENPKRNFVLKNIKTDTNGRTVCGMLDVEEKSFLLCNVYALNNDDPDYFVEMVKLMETYQTEFTIFGGDFNLVLNPEIDHNDSLHNHDKAYNVLTEYMNKADLVDVWRVYHPDTRRSPGTNG